MGRFFLKTPAISGSAVLGASRSGEGHNALISLISRRSFLDLIKFFGATAVMPAAIGRNEVAGSIGFFDLHVFGLTCWSEAHPNR